MHLHLVTGDEPTLIDLLIELHPKLLISYAHTKKLGSLTAVLQQPKSRLIIDSGAYSAFTLGKKIHPLEYVEWAFTLKKTIPKTTTAHFIMLDVIGDQEATWKNHKVITKAGLKTIPVITYGADMKHIDRAITEHEYFALGGLVPHARFKTRLQAWLDPAFARVTRHFKETGNMPQVHLLGITQQWASNRYPAYSSDSFSWMTPRKFGQDIRPGVRSPRWTENQATTMHMVRASIERFVELEATTTRIWKKRGITWND